MANAVTTAIPANARKPVFAIYGLAGVVIGATQVGFAAAEAGQPTWLTVTLAVYAFLGGAIGYTASSNTTDNIVLDEYELSQDEAQKVLDQMIVEGEVPIDEAPDPEAEPDEDADPEGLADDEEPDVETVEEVDEDAEPEGPADDEVEVDLTPPPEDYEPRH